jgi:hypothetical protein
LSDGLKRRKGWDREGKGFEQIKRDLANEFKCKFEFNQPKAMHQHECNK